MTRISFFLPVFALGSIALANDPVRLLIDRGDKLHASMQTRDALVEYEEALDRAPDDFLALTRVVRAYNDLGRIGLRRDTASESHYRKAHELATKLLELHPRRAESHFWYALSAGSLVPFRGVGDKIRLGKAVEIHSRKAIELDPNFAMGYVVLGIVLREGSRLSWIERMLVRTFFGEDFSGTLKESEDLLLKALHLDPDNSYAFYELGSTYRAMGDETRAVEAFLKAAAIPPKSEREELQQRTALRRAERNARW